MLCNLILSQIPHYRKQKHYSHWNTTENRKHVGLFEGTHEANEMDISISGIEGQE